MRKRQTETTSERLSDILESENENECESAGVKGREETQRVRGITSEGEQRESESERDKRDSERKTTSEKDNE